ncbi:FecCD family ABC transporter permease [Micropruina sonneratiae]|uniref:FecCD family ABC transporter permease n=1 Tax=Micropruina sonneratiae TaxID=2986940 RepID=UPI0022273DF5|nr:iron chelate uptake ABC transporter family permease subunit [Micropruina sp. KQZ13P-5]MCW3158535.1 iron chelate uptake ABC transporter family permease subunit [Micropruina sp. KQZ13P-5]
MTALRPRPGIAAATAAGETRSPASRAVGLLVVLVLLVAAVLASLAVGARAIPPLEVLQILFGQDSGQNALVVRQLRVPRTLIGLAVGAALGVAGALIQAVTRNPLADPGILGVNSGAAFALALGTALGVAAGPLGTLALAFLGAFAASVLVYAIGSLGRGGASPVRLILAGVALGAVLAGITQAIVLTDRERFAAMTAWQSGSLLDRDINLLWWALPFVGAGLVIALALGSSLNAIALGDDLAAALGDNVMRTRVLAVTAVMLLAGSATALAGPIAFVGLMVPHMVRWIVGPDQRWIVAYSVLAAPVLLLSADVVGRVLVPPGELPAGIVTALIGAPVLIVLVRRRKASEL